MMRVRLSLIKKVAIFDTGEQSYHICEDLQVRKNSNLLWCKHQIGAISNGNQTFIICSAFLGLFLRSVE